MKRSRFSEERSIAILKEQESGLTTADGCVGGRGELLQIQVEVWRAGGFRCSSSADAGAREREAEEALGGPDAGQCDAQGDQRKKVLTPNQRREAVAHLEEAFQVSHRRACGVPGVDRTMVRYVSRRSDDAKVCARIRELASERRRFGYRRLHWRLCREGWVMSHKKFRRLYREEKLQVRRRGGRKRTLGTRASAYLTPRP